jgi:drug/metabolite transporter (DMT)-like permease
MTVKYFSLSTFAIVLNMAPFCTLVIAALFLKETMTKLDVVSLIVAFSGVVLVIKGGIDKPATEE